MEMMTPELIARIENWTLIVHLCFWPVWFVAEMIILILRRKGISVRTISMVARDRGPKIASVVFAWNGLSPHFWIPAASWNQPTVLGGIFFWSLVTALLAQDVTLWKSDATAWPLWLKRQRFPGWVTLAGLALGWLLFPQRGVWP